MNKDSDREKHQPWYVGFTSFHGRNVPSMAEFKLSMLTVYMQSHEVHDKCSQHHYDAILFQKNETWCNLVKTVLNNEF